MEGIFGSNALTLNNTGATNDLSREQEWAQQNVFRRHINNDPAKKMLQL